MIEPTYLPLEERSGSGRHTVLGVNTADPEYASFWRHVDTSAGPAACWPWTRGCFAGTGYGRVYIDGKQRGAHRVAYRLAFGDFDPKLDVCHHCDNPPCCNPAHLFTGTPRDNLRDARDKGRLTRVFETGERATFHKLTWAAVRDIRVRSAAGESQRDLARKHGVSQTNVSFIVRGITWPEPNVAAAEGVSA